MTDRTQRRSPGALRAGRFGDGSGGVRLAGLEAPNQSRPATHRGMGMHASDGAAETLQSVVRGAWCVMRGVWCAACGTVAVRAGVETRGPIGPRVT